METQTANITPGKVIFIGKHGSGKTTLINSFLEKHISPNATLGVENQTIDVPYCNQIIHLSVWDSGDSIEFNTVLPCYIQSSQVAVLVFDQTDPETFSELKRWYEHVQTFEIPNILIIANKKDLPEVVPIQEVQQWCHERKLRLIRTSAKNDANVSNLFLSIAKLVVVDKSIPSSSYQKENEIINRSPQSHCLLL